MRVLVVLVVNVRVIMLDGVVFMLVGVPLGEMEPNAKRH